MPVHNKDIAKKLNEVADLLDLQGENEFRIRSYRNAARTISEDPESLEKRVKEEKDISGLPGIGESIAEKIEEIINTGELEDRKSVV